MTHALFDKGFAGKRIVVGTEQNVIAALNAGSGIISIHIVLKFSKLLIFNHIKVNCYGGTLPDLVQKGNYIPFYPWIMEKSLSSAVIPSLSGHLSLLQDYCCGRML